MIHHRIEDDRRPRGQCLDAADAATMGRAGAYGPPTVFFAEVAKRWSILFGYRIEARQVLLALLDMKLARAAGSRDTDSKVDLAGYAACLFEVDLLTPEDIAPAPPPAMRSRHWSRVRWFADIMDGKFLENAHKGEWRGADAEWVAASRLIDRLREETNELVHELAADPRDPLAVAREAADVANFALIIADLYGGGLGEV